MNDILDHKNLRREINAYLIGAFVPVIVIAIITHFAGGIAAHPKLPLLLMMIVPAISAMVVQRVIARRPILGPDGLSLRLGHWRPIMQGIMLMAMLLIACMLLSFVVTPDLLAAPKAWAESAARFPGPQMTNPNLKLIVGLCIVLLVGMVINLPLMLGEELGWRGFLTPRLRAMHGKRGILLTGAIWGAWHIPAILLGHNYPKEPWIGIPLFIVICIGLSIIFTKFADHARTVLAPAMMHGTLNVMSGVAFGVFVVDARNIDWLHGPTGLAMLVLLAPLSFWAYNTLPDKDNAAK